MKFTDYEKALSVPRIGRYRIACNGDKNLALILYRYNIKLCQKFYGVLGVLEIVLRNAVNQHFISKLNDSNWLLAQSQNGFLANSKETILKEHEKITASGGYTPDRLVASLSLGVWTFMFSKNCYRNSGKTLLQIFPNKAHGLNQRDIYADLDKIRTFRNRIAHHEPLCFNLSGEISVNYVNKIYALIIKYLEFLGYSANELLYGVETPLATIEKIKEIAIKTNNFAGGETKN